MAPGVKTVTNDPPEAESYNARVNPKVDEGLPWPGCVTLHPNPPFEYDPTLASKEMSKTRSMKQSISPHVCPFVRRPATVSLSVSPWFY